MRKVYAIGDCVLDVFFENNIPVEAKPGGSFLNSAVTLGRLGINVSLISELGMDRVGDQIKSFLGENGVDTQHISYFTDTNSNLALAYLDENKNADYSFYKTRKGLPHTVVFPTDVAKNDIILFGSFLAIKKEFRFALSAFLLDCKKKGALIIYDPNFRSQHLQMLPEVLPYIKENMALANVVKASNEDFQFICNSTNAEQAYQWMSEFSDALLIYTANKDGLFIHNKQEYYYTVPSIKPVSTVGAGDTVNAAIAFVCVRNGIKVSDLVVLSEKNRDDLARFATFFSQQVCMIYDNFLPIETASEYRL
ncbi:PfkB family carbohydrate kinase [Labilibaculum sp.]|uniref:PfkB family carbohydrate kinase n=1 Tax=Labilibaculum sp. TaxID=2060723 RepID=UPI003566DA86